MAKNISEIFDNQKSFFLSGGTSSVKGRIEALKKLQSAIKSHESLLISAMKEDLGKSEQEAYMCEIGLLYDELKYMISHLRGLCKTKRVRTGLATFPSKGYVYRQSYGNTLIMAPWNYPVLLSLDPLIGAIAGGNCAIVHPSEFAPSCAQAIETAISSVFDPSFIAVVQGKVEVSQELTQLPFDFVFFTGSPRVGSIIASTLAAKLIPYVLELGGKSPCIVTKNADIELSAKRILFGKAINAGQTCVAPDYVYVDSEVKESFLEAMKKEIVAVFPDGMENSPDYAKVISEKSLKRLQSFLTDGNAYFGGVIKGMKMSLALVEADFSSPVMQEEIFGPILPVVSYKDLDETIGTLKTMASPLACYVFSSDKAEAEKIISSLSFGGGCINDTLMHLSEHNLPFGGKGNSGMGNYHGAHSFYTFTTEKSILKKGKIDLPLRYFPFSEKKTKIIKKVLK